MNETEDSKAGIETLSIAKEEEKVINPVTDKSDPPSSPKCQGEKTEQTKPTESSSNNKNILSFI